MIKPGYGTSAFWLTVVGSIFSGAYLVGVLDDHSQKEDLIAESSRGVESFKLIMGQLAVLFRYIKGQTEVKKTWWGTANETERKEANKRNAPKKRKKPTSHTTKKAKPNE